MLVDATALGARSAAWWILVVLVAGVHEQEVLDFEGVWDQAVHRVVGWATWLLPAAGATQPVLAHALDHLDRSSCVVLLLAGAFDGAHTSSHQW